MSGWTIVGMSPLGTSKTNDPKTNDGPFARYSSQERCNAAILQGEDDQAHH
jgi:hypothetical protein